MPGLKRSPGIADMDPHDAHDDLERPGARHGSLDKLRKAQWPRVDNLQPWRSHAALHLHPYPSFAAPAPAYWPESPSDDGSSSDDLVHDGYENLISPPPGFRARASNVDHHGLPPTPPTMNNSDAAGSHHDQRAVSPTPFIDHPQALETKASGNSIAAVSPPTPDPSPPAVPDVPPAMEQLETSKSPFLSPIMAGDAQALKHSPSSKAESFITAREDPTRSTNPSTSRVHLPEDDTLPEHWLDNTRDLQLADDGLGDIVVQETPRQAGDSTPKATELSKTPTRVSKHESPPQTSEGDGADWEKHISYVSGPDELDPYPVVEEDTRQVEANSAAPSAPQGLGLFGAGLQQREIEHSAEDVNNMVYKRIREENVKRHSAISANSGAITVGIILPSNDSTPKTLKRQTKCRSLRGDNGTESHRGSIDGDLRPLSHKKIRLPDRQKKLDDSPVFESSIRQVSSPARLGPDASNMTALTLASLQDSPSARQGSKFQPLARNHTLRHLSHGDRLSNNFSIRRTSTHGSPASPNRWLEGLHDAEAPIVSPPRTPPRRTAVPMGHNVGVKRSSTEGARPSRVLEKSSNPVRGVIPSVTSEPDEWSPTTGRLRRFSREERLENNEHVRRTSLGSPSLATDDLYRPFSKERTSSLPSSAERNALSSPRKSSDARFLRPTTTPGSVSVFSDRTADIEVLEASGVRLYPHNNESLLLVQNGSRPVSKDEDIEDTRDLEPPAPTFTSQIDPPTPTIGATVGPSSLLDSPLTNPRPAPEPPVFLFIPPTPNKELERQVSPSEPDPPQRRLSLLQKARRYSDSLFIRTRPPPPPQREQDRDVHLSPLWRPQGFWDEFDSESEDGDYIYDDFEAPGSLPKGGDTSDVPETPPSAGIFPRVMSKRLPGFRGKGGFLVGNSLGIERHGTNTRRHYVGSSTRSVPVETARPANGARETRIVDGKRVWVGPAGKRRPKWVGVRALREHLRRRGGGGAEKEREVRREQLKGAIGTPRAIV